VGLGAGVNRARHHAQPKAPKMARNACFDQIHMPVRPGRYAFGQSFLFMMFGYDKRTKKAEGEHKKKAFMQVYSQKTMKNGQKLSFLRSFGMKMTVLCRFVEFSPQIKTAEGHFT
jgi:hypothetical protein